MNETTSFLIGCITMLIFFICLSPNYASNIEKSCQGTPWVIEEVLIKKTLTCTVEIKEKK